MRRRAGFTLIELLLALSLFSILVIALVQLLDTSLTIWDRTEVDRDMTEMGLSVTELLVDDLEAIEGGPRGDLVGEWVKFDTDGDGVEDTVWPRIRFVRQAGAAELLRMNPDTNVDPHSLGLMEVCWALLPTLEKDRDRRTVGVLWRGERRLDDVETLSFFDPDFFTPRDMPVSGALNQVTGGVLWFEIVYAAQTSILREEWKVGSALPDCAQAWDAWSKGRPDDDLTELNARAAGAPPAIELPVLPRRVRVHLEIERPAELRRRTRLDETIEQSSLRFRVIDERRLPAVGTYLRIDEEWMLIQSKSGAEVSVKRAQRGTRAKEHTLGAMVHYGAPLLREVVVSAYREDWNLRASR